MHRYTQHNRQKGRFKQDSPAKHILPRGRVEDSQESMQENDYDRQTIESQVDFQGSVDIWKMKDSQRVAGSINYRLYGVEEQLESGDQRK